MSQDWKWVDIDQWTDRCKVPGGWLVRNSTTDMKSFASVSMVFVPDPRQQIAAQCLQGLLADCKFNVDTESFAEIAVELADALLVQLNKEPSKTE